MKLVISAVNLTEGGPLTVLREAVRAAADQFPTWQIVVAVHRIGMAGDPRVTEIAFPAPKSSWIRRLWLEWIGFKRLSREWQPDVWLSLHDITPRVVAKRQYVYCHNPAPFSTRSIPLERLDTKFRLFRKYYGVLYNCFIGRNSAVIVQQDWLRQRFIERYGLRRVIVAHPSVSLRSPIAAKCASGAIQRFVYPAFPRVFKNHELLGECAKILESNPHWKGEILITIDGSENEYASVIQHRYGGLRSLRFIGLLTPDQLSDTYRNSDALIFPSVLETWGLPLTEAKAHQLPIFAADLPYAHETVGNYEQVSFFDPSDPVALAHLLLDVSLGHAKLATSRMAVPKAPFAEGWTELLKILLVDDETPAAKPSRALL